MNDDTTDTAMLARSSFERTLIKKAWADRAFRERLMHNPRETIEAEIGMPLPPSLAIEVLEETPTKMYLTLWADPDVDSTPNAPNRYPHSEVFHCYIKTAYKLTAQ